MFNYNDSWHACCEPNGPFSAYARLANSCGLCALTHWYNIRWQVRRMPNQVHIFVFHFVQTICSDMNIQHDIKMQWMLYGFELTHIIYSFVISAKFSNWDAPFHQCNSTTNMSNNGCRLIIDFWCGFPNALHFYQIINHTSSRQCRHSNNFLILTKWVVWTKTISSQISKHIRRRLFNV